MDKTFVASTDSHSVCIVTRGADPKTLEVTEVRYGTVASYTPYIMACFNTSSLGVATDRARREFLAYKDSGEPDGQIYLDLLDAAYRKVEAFLYESSSY